LSYENRGALFPGPEKAGCGEIPQLFHELSVDCAQSGKGVSRRYVGYTARVTLKTPSRNVKLQPLLF
jgi:hypothetical protein